MNLIINGSLALTILDIVSFAPLRNTKSGRDIEQGVFDNLQQGEYIINLKERLIYDINEGVNSFFDGEDKRRELLVDK